MQDCEEVSYFKTQPENVRYLHPVNISAIVIQLSNTENTSINIIEFKSKDLSRN